MRIAALLLLLAVPARAAAQAGGDSVRVGERVLLRVDGEPTLTDTFTVMPGPAIALPGIGSVPLAGAHRADLGPYLQSYLTRYLRAPKVQATVLMRVAVLGEVAKPGYYAVQSSTPLADLVMLAGGPTHDALMSRAKIERDQHDVAADGTLANAMARGATVGAAGLQSGDQIVVPAIERRDPESTFRIISILVALPVAVYGIARLF